METWGNPFIYLRHELTSSPMWTRKQRFLIRSHTMRMHQNGRYLDNLKRRPVCQMVSCTAVRSKETAPLHQSSVSYILDKCCEGCELVRGATATKKTSQVNTEKGLNSLGRFSAGWCIQKTCSRHSVVTGQSSNQSINQYRKCLHRDVASTIQIITLPVHKIHNSKQLLR